MSNKEVMQQAALIKALDHIVRTIEKQLSLIKDRAPGDYLDKRPVVQSLQSHAKHARAAIAQATALEQPEQQAQTVQAPTQWRDMVVATLVREGINKHRARELADHFAAQPEQEPVGYDKTDLNRFVQDLYDEKMQEGKHGHYETMFYVVHRAIKKVAPPKQQAEPVISAWSLREVYFDEDGEPLMHRSPPAAQRPWQGLTDEDRRKFAAAQYGWEDLLIAAEAKLKERNRGATTHCQCAACKNGNIHDSDCSVHNGDALPVGPCDCSLATPPVQPAEPAQTFYQPAANEAVEILKSLGYVYEPTYTGLAWVAKKSAQPEQQAEPIGFINSPGPITQYIIPTQRPWVGLTDEEILRTDPWEILRADPWTGPSDSNINPYQILLKVRTLEAKLKERNT